MWISKKELEKRIEQARWEAKKDTLIHLGFNRLYGNPPDKSVRCVFDSPQWNSPLETTIDHFHPEANIFNVYWKRASA